MKKQYFSLVLILCSSLLIAQNNDFNNGGGDFLWSNSANWSLGTTPNTSETIRSTITGSVVDANFTLFKIQNTFATENNVSFGGGGTGTLTINPGGNNLFGILNVSDFDVKLSFSGNVTIDNPSGITLMRNENGNTNDLNDIEFENGSVLTLNTNLEARTGTGGDIFNFNGTLAGTAALRLGANTTCVFGNTSDNTGFAGDFVWVGQNAQLTVNAADNNVFLPSDRKLQINAINGSVEVNGENVFQGNLTVGGTHTFTFHANKNQNAMGSLIFSDSGTLNLVIDNSVTNLSFADNSASPWNTGTLNITGYQEGVVRFGTDSNGLTTDQLMQITVDGSGGAVALDANGYLVNASSLSTDDIQAREIKPIAYPTLALDRIFFSELQKDVKIVDLNGKVLWHNKTENQSEVSVNFLTSGIYLIVFDNKKVEKFIKQ